MSESPVARGPSRCRELVKLFHSPLEDFGTVAPVTAAQMPLPARELLDHTSHMTVTMERFHGGPVSLEVVRRTECADGRYAREILLRRGDGRVVQHGIVRIDLPRLAADVAADIRSEAKPLGRILIAADLLCDVRDVELLKIAAGQKLADLLHVNPGTEVFGRVALISMDGRPIIDLLEIVVPTGS
jgi:chorismate-pyruvate lyase